MMAARPSAARLLAKLAPIPALLTTSAAEWPIWPRPKTSTIARSHRTVRNRCHGSGRRLRAAAVAPLTMKAGAGDPPPGSGRPQLQGLCGEKVPPGTYRIKTGATEPDQNGERRQYAEGEGAHVDQDAGKLTACVLHDTDKERGALAWRGAPVALKKDARAKTRASLKSVARWSRSENSIRPASRRAKCPRTGRRSRIRHRGWQWLAAAGCAVGALGHLNDDGAVLADPAADLELAAAGVDHLAFVDPDGRAVGRLANALLGRDDHAPEPS